MREHTTLNGQKAKLAAAAVLAACLAIGITAICYVFPPYQQETTTPGYTVSVPLQLPRIYIREDGSVDPPTDAIMHTGSIYTFTKDIVNFTLVIQRDNIVIDGASRSLKGYAQGNIKGYAGILIYNRTNVTITALKIEQYWIAVEITNSSKITIKGNTLKSDILVQSSTSCTIMENTIAGGIRVEGSSDNIIGKNRISHALNGVFLSGSSFNIVKENTFENCDCAIQVQGTFETVLNNHIRKGRTGITIDGSDNKILGNYIEENSEGGIYLHFGNNNTIYENTVENNMYGVIIGFAPHLNAENNTFHHNNFLNNARNVLVRVGGFTNFWDDGKEGNYWSDYKGVDDDKDGIGDTPYVIDEHNRDNHPLMNPWTEKLIKQGEMPPTLLIISLATILGGTLTFVLLKIHVKNAKTIQNVKLPPKTQAYACSNRVAKNSIFKSNGCC